MIINTKLGKVYTLGELGFWEIVKEGRVSMFLDMPKGYLWRHLLPDSIWTHRYNFERDDSGILQTNLPTNNVWFEIVKRVSL